MAAITAQQESRIRNAFRLIAVRSLGDIRERLAFDLLERACQSGLALAAQNQDVAQRESRLPSGRGGLDPVFGGGRMLDAPSHSLLALRGDPERKTNKAPSPQNHPPVTGPTQVR